MTVTRQDRAKSAGAVPEVYSCVGRGTQSRRPRAPARRPRAADRETPAQVRLTGAGEPTYQNLFVKSNLSGEFTVVNPYLVADLKAAGLWDEVMVNDLKYYDGSVSQIDRIPDELKELYATAFEMDARWLVEAGSRRQKWIDQSQSLNLYMEEPNGKKLDNLYKLAWVRGLKTTYYLRSMGATHVEKSTLADGKLNAVETGSTEIEGAGQACAVLDPDCEACQ